MSAVVEKTASTRNRNNRGRNGGGRARAVIETAEGNEESKPPREVIPSPPFPLAQLGQTVSGKICDVVKRGRGQFGFIYVGEGSHSETPRVYFNYKEYTETKYPPRKGYLVEFECSEDDSDRVFARNVRLTTIGLKEAADRDEKFLSSRDNTPKEQNGERKERRQKKEDSDGRSVVLKVTCEGESETKQVTANTSLSIGKLKHSATMEFCAPIEFQVFCRITSETPDGVLLSRAILNEMSDNDVIHIRPATAIKA